MDSSEFVTEMSMTSIYRCHGCHIPHKLAPIVYITFLATNFNRAVAEVTGPRVNRSAGSGMEVLCTITDSTDVKIHVCAMISFSALCSNKLCYVCNTEFRVFHYRGQEVYRDAFLKSVL